MTPYVWLHITAWIARPVSEISREGIQQMASVAGRLLADIPPAHVTIGKILYHPEAIMLAVTPTKALLPVFEAVREATREVTGSPGQAGSKLPWTPHITIAYSTALQPAEPIINSLGPSLPERKVQINQVSLVIQRGPERNWDWRPEVTIRLGISP
jgi:2'-5' RNA ligase